MNAERTPSNPRDESSLLWGLTLGLCLTAASLFQAVESDAHAPRWRTAGAIAAIAFAVSVGGWQLRRISRRLQSDLVYSPVVLLIAAGSLAWEPLQRSLWETGRPLETSVMFVLKNVMLSLAAVSWMPSQRRLAALCSLFLLLFCLALNPGRAALWPAAGYIVCGVAWLSAEYWESLRRKLLRGIRRDGKGRGLGWIAAVALVCAAGAAGLSSEAGLRAWRGLLPGSGGQEGSDPFARDGVGDGEMLVAGHENISSFANLEDAPFRASEQPSLYDVFNDAYDEPIANRRQERAIPLPSSVGKVLEERLANSKRGAREFSTLREQKRARPARQRDLDSPALLYVSGRVPLHLRLETYDIFDGITWHADNERSELTIAPLALTEIDGKPWLTLREHFLHSEVRLCPEPHAVKVVDLDTNRIPAPLNLRGIHIPLVDRPDFFEFAQESILAMKRDRLPDSITIRMTSQLVDEESIPTSRGALGWSVETHRTLPRSPRNAELIRLAEEWSGGAADGWPTVRAIVEGLRGHCVFDRSARPPADCEFTADHFLFESRRGDDYQFATAAALLLRSRGYSTRLVSGFYAAPDRFETRSGLTPLLADDVHVWLEVYLGKGLWQTVDPTPGYAVLQPLPGFWRRAWLNCVGLADWARSNWIGVMLAAIVATIGFRRRYDLLDSLVSARKLLMRPRQSREMLIATGWRLESRLRWCGRPRPSGVTPADWARECRLYDLLPRERLRQFFADWTHSVFAPESFAADGERRLDEIRELCAEIERVTRLSRMRTHLRAKTLHSSLGLTWRQRIAAAWSTLRPDLTPRPIGTETQGPRDA